jgi:hypothetical protein
VGASVVGRGVGEVMGVEVAGSIPSHIVLQLPGQPDTTQPMRSLPLDVKVHVGAGVGAVVGEVGAVVGATVGVAVGECVSPRFVGAAVGASVASQHQGLARECSCSRLPAEQSAKQAVLLMRSTPVNGCISCI